MRLPKKLWHQSDPKFRDSILEKGLEPRVGKATRDVYNDLGVELPKPFVYLQDMTIDIYGTGRDLDIWEIDTDKLNKDLVRIDPLLQEFCYIYPDIIEPSTLKLIHKGTGESFRDSSGKRTKSEDEIVEDILSYINKQKTAIPEKLYHKGNPKFRDEILRDGLEPRVGECYSLFYTDNMGYTKDELEPLVFLYDKNIQEYDSTYDDDIYEIDTNKLDKDYLYKDKALPEYCYTYKERIWPTALKLIHKGTGDDNF